MAGSSDSNDASDIFWPGYVDAISNLAINLLFVIAVMCIVILSFVLEETTKGTPREGTVPQDVQYVNDNPNTHAAQLQELQLENAKLKETLQALQKSSATPTSTTTTKTETQAKTESTTTTNNVPNNAPKMEVVQARQEVVKEAKGESSVNTVGAGLIVNFDPKVVTLSADESKNVVSRLEAFGPVKTTRWQITVITPKGFSESSRLGYYRAVAVRNVLIQAGTPGELINMRVIESVQSGADSARVTVNAAP
ncbi:hypothetical protein B9Z51_15225 [Limnohabitans sp. T6-5]|uniref:hypothetical protein n=1 Tax=Limnohabitans sp. T6-5 TaxID=1100724 RepID=UPI000D3A21F4|nr:hypothetical protein [Limnohabitans sp. T6-5]PUE07210.1 hypothetical protein B9Z51_15225 [Limnohabitans sp. T6-5]